MPHVCRGPYGGQDPNLLGNPLLTGNLANSLADSLGLTQGLAAVPPSQSLPTGLPNGLPGNGALGFNMGLPNGGGRHHIDSLSAVCPAPLSVLLSLLLDSAGFGDATQSIGSFRGVSTRCRVLARVPVELALG